jgi:hypothetical protein
MSGHYPPVHKRLSFRRLSGLAVVRYGLPVAVALAGGLVMSFGGEANLEGGAGILSAGLAIYFINWLFRIGADGEHERDAERAARDYFTAHGHWPGEGQDDQAPPEAQPSLSSPELTRSARPHLTRLRDGHSRRRP